MKISFHMTLAVDAKAKEAEIDLPRETKIEELIKQMNVAIADVGIILKNGKWVQHDSYAGNDDRIEVFPELAGG